MNQIITATFENGVLRPDEPLMLTSGTRLRLVVQSTDYTRDAVQKAWVDLEQLCDESSMNSGGERLTRGELHERR